jgi:PE family
MLFVTTQPEVLAAAAGALQGIGSAMSAQNAAAAAPTTGVIPADEAMSAICALSRSRCSSEEYADNHQATRHDFLL